MLIQKLFNLPALGQVADRLKDTEPEENLGPLDRERKIYERKPKIEVKNVGEPIKTAPLP